MTKGTIIRTVVLFVALVNQILVMGGKSPLPFEDAEVEMFVSTALTAVASLIAWWKNNSITKEAQEADAYMWELKGKR